MFFNNLSDDFWVAYGDEALSFVEVLVIATQGSTYRKAGARMLVCRDGRQWGMVAGGCFDGLIRDEAYKVIDGGVPSIFSVDTRSEDDAVFGSGLGCQGRVDMLLRVLPKEFNERDLLRHLGIGYFDVAETRQHCHDGEVVFVEQIPASNRVFIFGNGDDAAPLAHMLDLVGYITTVVCHANPNPRFESLPRSVSVLQLEVAAFFARYSPRELDYVVIMTHKYELDRFLIGEWAKHAVSYLGLLGPRLRGDRIINELLADGFVFPPSFYSRFYNPCGIDLKGYGPEGIALAITSEIQLLSFGGRLKHLSEWNDDSRNNKN